MASNSTKSDTFKETKEYLMSTIDRGGKTSRRPMGAVDTVWMTMMAAPNEPHNQVYPGIILGDASLAEDTEGLTKAGVTHVLNCAQGKKFNQVDTTEDYYKDSGIGFLGVPATDIMTYKMAKHFDRGGDFIKEVLDANGKVYVHCKSGVSRSATLVLVYLIKYKGMTLLSAAKAVREFRKILPNDGFLRELATLSDSIHSNDQT